MYLTGTHLSINTCTVALSLVVYDIFNVEKYCDLEIALMGQSWLLKVVPFDTLYMVSY